MKRKFVRRMICAALAAVVCLSGMLVSSTEIWAAEVESAPMQTGDVVEIPLCSTDADIWESDTELVWQEFKQVGTTNNVTAIKTQKSALAITFMYEENSGKNMSIGLFEDESCKKQIAVAEGEDGYGYLEAVVEEGIYYVKLIGQTDATFIGYWMGMSYSLELPEEVTNFDLGYYYYAKESGTSFRVTLPSDGIFSFLLLGTQDLFGEGPIKVILYDENKEKIPGSEKYTEDYCCEYALKQGTYYVELSGGTGIYTMYVGFDPYVNQENTSKKNAVTLKEASSKEGTLPLDDSQVDERWYKFKLKEDCKNRVEIQNTGDDSDISYRVYKGENLLLSGTIAPYEDVVVNLSKGNNGVWKKGTYYIKICKKDKNSNSSFTISRIGYIQNMKIAKVGKKSYTGGPIEPSLTIKRGTKVLKEGRDYKLSYMNNHKVGVATIMVTGIGNYKGTTTVDFQIVPRSIVVKNAVVKKSQLKVKWKQASAVNGYEIRYATKKNMQHAEKKVLRDGDKTSVTIKGLNANKNYFVQVRSYKIVKGKKYYSKWSAVRKAKRA